MSEQPTGALTREQVEEAIEGGDADMFLRYVAQQTQAIERLETDYSVLSCKFDDMQKRCLAAERSCIDFRQALAQQAQEVEKHNKLLQLLHFIIEHDGEFDNLESVKADAEVYGLENVLKLKKQAQEVERLVLELAAIKDERALIAITRCAKCGESCNVVIEYGRPVDSRDIEILKLRQSWKEELQKRCSVQAEREELKQQLAAMTTERDEWKDQWRKTNDEFVRTAIKLSQQNGELAASQARCRELEALVGTIRGCLDIQPIRNVRDIGVEEHSREIIGQLQATLAAREAEIVELETRRNETISMCEQLRSERDAAVQELTRLNERLIPNSVSGSFDFSVLPIERCLTDTEKKIMQETQEVLNDQHASGSSGGSANSGMGE